MDERRAIARLKRGDIDGLAVLVRCYQEKALRVAYLITQDRPLAQDVIQDTYIQAYERIHQFDSSRPFKPWFLRSVANAAVQAARRQQRTVPLEQPGDGEVELADLLAESGPGPDDIAGQHELQAAIEQALSQLTPEQRAVIVMRYYLDYSEREIAEELDRPAGTVKSRLHAARRRLQGLLRLSRQVEG